MEKAFIKKGGQNEKIGEGTVEKKRLKKSVRLQLQWGGENVTCFARELAKKRSSERCPGGY